MATRITGLAGVKTVHSLATVTEPGDRPGKKLISAMEGAIYSWISNTLSFLIRANNDDSRDACLEMA